MLIFTSLFLFMITLYGIPNCDTVQKAVKWLNSQNIPFHFHSYKELGIEKKTLKLWLKHFPVGKLVNTRSTTYKELGDDEKNCLEDNEKAMAVMMKHNSVIKRPVWDFGDGRFFLGWDEKALSKMV